MVHLSTSSSSSSFFLSADFEVEASEAESRRGTFLNLCGKVLRSMQPLDAPRLLSRLRRYTKKEHGLGTQMYAFNVEKSRR